MDPIAPRSKTVVLSLTAVLIVAIAWIDYQTGYELGMGAMYLLPVFLAAWYCGWVWGVSSAFLAALGYFLADLATGHPYSLPFYRFWDALNQLAVFLALAWTAARIRSTMAKEHLLNQQLKEALKNVRELEGLLPICAWCKRIRNDQGYWEILETYIAPRSKASFTHSICPECKAKILAEGKTPDS